jgi:hypothetical protein
VRPSNPWDLKGSRRKQGEPLCDYIWRFSQKCHELPSVADADIASAFWDGIMCHSLVHELSREQPKTTKELLNIATRHASGEEAVGANFTLAKEGVAIGGGQTAPLPMSPSEAPKKVRRRGKSTTHVVWLRWQTTIMSRRSRTPTRSLWW